MSCTSNHPLSPRDSAIAQTYDPFTVLSDLEITLILGFLSVDEVIRIRRVSQLWKVCVDFRLSTAAIGRYFPIAKENKTIQLKSGWEEEALAFRKLAHSYGACARASMARRFEVTRGKNNQQLWCICDHHMVSVIEDSVVMIERIWDPDNLTCKTFPAARRKNFKSISFRDRPWNAKPAIIWVASDDKNGIVVLNFQANCAGDYLHWLLALSVHTGKVIWHRKRDWTILSPLRKVNYPETCSNFYVSFGHGIMCFMGSSNKWDHSSCSAGVYRARRANMYNQLIIIDVFTGELKGQHRMPDDYYKWLETSYFDRWNVSVGVTFGVHPTKEVYFLVTDKLEMWVVSTKTGELITQYTILPYEWGTHATERRNNLFFGDDGRVWLVHQGGAMILSYEIEPEEFQVVKKRAWSLEFKDSDIPTLQVLGLDPTSGIAYLRMGPSVGRVVAVKFEPTSGSPNYHIMSVEDITLPPKKSKPVKKVKGGKRPSHENGEPAETNGVLSNGRRMVMEGETAKR